MAELFDPRDNSSAYRRRLKKIGQSPCVPFLGVHLSDLTFLNEVRKKLRAAATPDLQAQLLRQSQFAQMIE